MTYAPFCLRDQTVMEWRAEIDEIEAKRAADAALVGMTPDEVRGLLLHHAADEPCQRRAPEGWREWCAEFDRLALAFADALRRNG